MSDGPVTAGVGGAPVTGQEAATGDDDLIAKVAAQILGGPALSLSQSLAMKATAANLAARIVTLCREAIAADIEAALLGHSADPDEERFNAYVNTGLYEAAKIARGSRSGVTADV